MMKDFEMKKKLEKALFDSTAISNREKAVMKRILSFVRKTKNIQRYQKILEGFARKYNVISTQGSFPGIVTKNGNAAVESQGSINGICRKKLGRIKCRSIDPQGGIKGSVKCRSIDSQGGIKGSVKSRSVGSQGGISGIKK